MNYTEQKIEKQIESHIKDIASILAKGRDVELRKDSGDNLKIIEVLKRIR